MPIDLDNLRIKKKGRNTFYFRVSDDRPTCGAKLANRPKNVRCANYLGLGPRNGRCRMHGRDAGAPLVHGRYSKHLPDKIAAAYDKSLSDLKLLDQMEGCAALDAIAKRAATLVKEKDSPEWRKQLLAQWRAAKRAVRQGKAPEMSEEVRILGGMIEAGASEVSSLRFFQDAVERTSKRVEASWRTRLDKEHAINGEDLVAIFAGFLKGVHQILNGNKQSKEIERFCYNQLLGKHHADTENR